MNMTKRSTVLLVYSIREGLESMMNCLETSRFGAADEFLHQLNH